MKITNNILSLVIIIAIVACVSFLINIPQEEQNVVINKPSMPAVVNLKNGSINVGIDTIIYWKCIDYDSDSNLVYDVYFGTENPPSRVATNYSYEYYDPGKMQYNTIYYWRIVTKYENGVYTEGPIWVFKTIDIPNNPPHMLKYINPYNGKTNVKISSTLIWSCVDPDQGDFVTYDIYFGTSNPPTLAFSNYKNTSYNTGKLEYDTIYYWKILAFDNHGEKTIGSTYSFKTESSNDNSGGGSNDEGGKIKNHQPYIPSNPYPEDNMENIDIRLTLNWEGGDPDPSDLVTYDVYFGTTNPPLKMISNISESVFDPELLESGTKYFWKIISWDEQGKYSESQVWSFTTKLLFIELFNPTPSNNSTNISIDSNIEWNIKEINYTVNLTYDIYFDIINPPSLIVSNISNRYLLLDDLIYNSTYFWRIVVWNDDIPTFGPIWSFTTENKPYSPPPSIVWVNNDFNKSIYGWNISHFSSIQKGIDAVNINGTVNVLTGTYYENIFINKTINLNGTDKKTTIIDGGKKDDVIFIQANLTNISNFGIINSGISNGITYYYSSNNSIINCGISNNNYGIYLSNSNFNNILNCDFNENSHYGISLSHSSCNNILNNNIRLNDRGIYLSSSCYNKISKNDISNNLEGIYIHTSFKNNINHNNIFKNNWGICLYSCNNNDFLYNNIELNFNLGIYFYYASNNNTINGNNISLNKDYGICIHSSNNNNKIYQNKLMNNTCNGYDEGKNSWDNGINFGGNFWHDYIGKDNNGDGIGDTPYLIPGNGENLDRYPLKYFGERDNLTAYANGPYSGLINKKIQLYGKAAGGIPPYTWYWDFGDGTSSILQNPTHIYTQVGTYKATLIVKDSNEKAYHTSNDTALISIIKNDIIPPLVEIKSPNKGIYFKNRLILPIISRLIKTTVIFHEINISVTAIDETGIEKVDFFIDDEYKASDYSRQHIWTWSEKSFSKHTIKVIAYDNAGNTATDELIVWKFF